MPSKLNGWSNMLFNGISHYLEANLEFLLLCYFFAWAFCLGYFYAFSNYEYIQFLLNRCVKPETGWWGEVNLEQNQPTSPTPWQAGTTFSPTSSQPDLFTVYNSCDYSLSLMLSQTLGFMDILFIWLCGLSHFGWQGGFFCVKRIALF